MLGVELIEQLYKKPVAATTLELRTESQIDLGREALVFPL
ncbi:MAG: hypothetical protein QOH06_2259 [Acidobacteriota bacterium]|nr:hypothetical protein [Acidobacteriota bacterium]